MSNYPYSQDNNTTLPGVSGSTQEDVAITALRSATFAIEQELGIKPSGIYSDVRARLDIMEARINYAVPSGFVNQGYILSPLILFNNSSNVTLTISDGYGVPTENRVNGSLFMRADGYANNELYVRRSGTWKPIQTDLWVAGGDLSGTYTSQTVIGLRGKSLSSSLSTTGATQDGYHLTWDNTDGYWRAETGFIAGGDLAILSGPWGRTGQTVIKLQGRNVSNAAPGGTTTSDGDALAWDPTTSQWQPRTRAVIFDGYAGRTNLRSNRILQSPIDTTKTGIVNFSSRSTGAATGATNDYAAILSGDRHAVSGNFGLVTAGDSHVVSGQYGAVVNGLGNTASGQYSSVLDGYSNVASAIASFILNGGSNQANAAFSGILGGIGNSTASGATHSGIGWGTSNQISAAGIYGLILGGSGNTLISQNGFIGNATSATVQSSYGAVHSGLTNTVSSSSNFATVLNGSNVTVTGNYATVLNANTGTANGLHATILNGASNSVTASYSMVGNGQTNIISGGISYGVILDGYNNSLSGTGCAIIDGYSNSITGTYSTIVNGNNNLIASFNSTILNGSNNTMDASSQNNAILAGTGNSLTSSNRIVIAGHGNTFTNVTSAFILGRFNTVQGSSTKITGDSNTIGSGSNFNRIFGNSNSMDSNSIQNSIFGANNTLVNSTHDSMVLGSTNIVDGYGNQILLGANNIGNSNFGFVFGQYGKSRLFGQQVQANSRFTAGKIGEAQWSRIVLSGTSNSGAAIQLLLQDTVPVPPSFQDGYSYEMTIRVLVVNTSPLSTNPVVPARFVFDVLAHQESGSLVIDHINESVITKNTSDDPSGATRTLGWSVTLSTSTNQLLVTVDPETSSANYVQPQNTPSNRRAVATVEWRELSRI